MKLETILSIIRNGDELILTGIIDQVPRGELTSLIDKLKRYKYDKYKLTKVAISKLKWRRGW